MLSFLNLACLQLSPSPFCLTVYNLLISLYPFAPPSHYLSTWPALSNIWQSYAGTARRMATWEHELREMFTQHDKDMSGFISKDDVICMLMGADKDEQKDPAWKANLKFLINVIKSADKDGDQKISFDEFKAYIDKATQ